MSRDNFDRDGVAFEPFVVRLDEEGCNEEMNIHEFLSDQFRQLFDMPATCRHYREGNRCDE